MEFFKGVNVDWMGKAKYFVALSLILAGGGMGFDSEEWRACATESTSAAARWCMCASRVPPPIDQIRKGLAVGRA